LKTKLIVLLVGMALLVGILSGCTETTTNVAPVALITCVTTGVVGADIEFGSISTDADGTVASWSWSIGAGDEVVTKLEQKKPLRHHLLPQEHIQYL